MLTVMKKIVNVERRELGRFPDESDRHIEYITTVTITVSDDNGVVKTFVFDHDPVTAQEIITSFFSDTYTVDATKKDEIELTMLRTAFEKWQMWKITRDEAIARGESVTIIDILNAKVDNMWNNYRTIVIRWYQATN